MATKLSRTTGNFTAATTWATVDAASEADSEQIAQSVPSAYQYSLTFTPGATAVEGIAIKVNTVGNPTGTMSVILANNTTPGTREASATINVTDIKGQGWYFFKFASPVTPNGTDVYKVGVLCSVNNAVNLYCMSSSSNWSRFLRLTTTAAPAANDKLIIMGECTGPGTQNSITVTMDNTTTTLFGLTQSNFYQSISVNAYSTLSYGTAYSTNYYLRFQGVMAVFAGGTFNIGKSGGNIAYNSTAVLEFSANANVDCGLEVRGGTFNAFGNAKWPAWGGFTQVSNTTPIQISVAGHGLVVGERVTISGIGGNTAANGTWEVASVPDANNFVIGAINGAYPGPGAGTSTGNGTYQPGTGVLTRLPYSKMNNPRGGLCTTTANSTSIVGTEGQSFIGLTGTINIGGTNYTIASVTDATHLTLTGNYGSSTYNAQWLHAATGATVTLLSTAGCSPGDVLVFPSTDRTPARSEVGTISTVDSGTQVTLTAPLANNHGGYAPIQAEVGNITRNVKIRGISPTQQGYLLFFPTATVACNYAEFSQLGSGTANKRGVEAQTTTGSCSISYCSFHDFVAGSSVGFNLQNNSNNVTFNNNVTWKIANTHFQTAVTPNTWMADANLFVYQTDSGAYIATLNDIGGTFTNNTMVGGTSAGFYAPEAAVAAPWYGNTAHSHSNYGFYWLGVGTWPACSNMVSYRNGNTGFYFSNIHDSVFTRAISWGNGFGLNQGGVYGITLVNCQSHADVSFTGGTALVLLGSGMLNPYLRFENCNFNVASITPYPNFLISSGNDLNVGNNNMGDATFRNCYFAALITGIAPLSGLGVVIRFENLNCVLGDNRWYTCAGVARVDTTIYKNPPQSLRLTSNTPVKMVSNLGWRTGFMVPVTGGFAKTISVMVRTSVVGDGTAYAGSPPRLMLRRDSSLGVANNMVLATWSGPAGTWVTLSGNTPVASNTGTWECYVDSDNGGAGWVNVQNWNAVTAPPS